MNFTPRYSDSGVLAMLIIASNASANDAGKISIIKQHLIRMRVQTARGLNSIRVHIAPTELTPSSAFYAVLSQARDAGVEVVADSLNAAFYSMSLSAFRDYVGNITHEQITTFCVDDCQRFTDLDLAKMAKVVTQNGGKLLLSTGAKRENAERIRKVTALTHSHFELQAYRQGEGTNWPAIWIPLFAPACWAFEFHKDDSGKMTTADDISGMWNHALKLPLIPKWLSVYGQDDTTNLLSKSFAQHWVNFNAGMDKWWGKQLI